MKLENLRTNDIGKISLWFPKLGNGSDSFSILTYPHLAQLAFYQSAQQIEELEFSLATIRQGTAIQTCVGSWFISIEAYLNSILRASCLATSVSFEKFKKKDLDHRIKSLFDILKIDRTNFYNGAFQRLAEFKQYRNELFHDRTYSSVIDFKKTVFSGNPMYANQVDAMQAAVISIEIYEAFRYIIPRLDLMPKIMVMKSDSFFFTGIDKLYARVLRPFFEGALEKHSLTSAINLEIRSTALDSSPIFLNTAIQPILKAESDLIYEHPAAIHVTALGRDLFQKIIDEVVFDTEKNFMIANYYKENSHL